MKKQSWTKTMSLRFGKEVPRSVERNEEKKRRLNHTYAFAFAPVVFLSTFFQTIRF
jgi:hypothetical protein